MWYPEHINVILQVLAPEFAPLPQPFSAFLFHQTEKALFGSFQHLELSSGILGEEIWKRFLAARALTLFYLAPAALRQNIKLSNSFVQRAIMHFDPNVREKKRLPSETTIRDWQARGLMHSASHGVRHLQRVAALLTMRRMSYLQRDWLPSSISDTEPWFYVWGIHPGDTTPQMYPVPLPQTLKANTLLYSTWAGTAWSLPGWMSIGQYGAVGWAGWTDSETGGRYSLSLTEIQQWHEPWTEIDATFLQAEKKYSSLFPGFPRVAVVSLYEEERCHRLASELLPRIGEMQLKKHLQGLYGSTQAPEVLRRVYPET
ncbi:MAG TPA: hypothetical protein VFV38_30425 [Ktedonobacteraceae bacterium]|nr:hypothetical protein [Ktedonobacteraceae bacterium]